MKTLQFFIIACLFSIRLFSQDTLFTKNGEMIAGKVMEVNSEEVKYKKSSNPDGPLYTIKKSDVVVIEYKNGSRDVFTSYPGSSSNTSSSNTSPDDSYNTATASNNQQSNNQQSNPVYVTPRPAFNVIIGALPFFGGWGGWGWGGYGGWGYGGGWGGWGFRRPYYGGGWGGYRGGWGGYHGGWGGYHGGGGGHYGHRGGHR